jgi:hypothetical protein
MHKVLPVEEREQVSVAHVRAWARKAKGSDGNLLFPDGVGQRGHLPKLVVDEFNRRMRTRKATDLNPWSGPQRGRKESNEGE